MTNPHRKSRIAYVGRKGGVGKTSATLSVADDLVHRHLQTVLVIDMDPQSNATAWLGIKNPERTMSDALYSAHIDGALNNVIVASRWDNVWCAPAEETLASREADRDHASTELRLRRLLRTADLTGIDTVLIDAPPSLGPLLSNALNAVDTAFIVTDSERGGLDGVGRMLDAIHVVAEDSNQALTTGGLVMNHFSLTISEHKERWVELQQLYPDYTHYRLPRRAAVGTAFGASAPVRAFSGGAAYVYAVRDLVDDWLKEAAADG